MNESNDAQELLTAIRNLLSNAGYDGGCGYKDLSEPQGVVDGVRWMIEKRDLLDLDNHAQYYAGVADEKRIAKEKADTELRFLKRTRKSSSKENENRYRNLIRDKEVWQLRALNAEHVLRLFKNRT